MSSSPGDATDPRGPAMVAMLEDGALMKDVAAAYGLSYERVRSLVRAAGYAGDRRYAPTTHDSRRREQRERRDAAQRALAENPRAPYREVAAMLGLERTTVRSYVEMDGDPALERRSAGRALARSMDALGRPGRKTVGDDELLAEVRTAARELGEPLGVKRFDAWKGYCRSQLLILRFGSWRAACELAGVRSGAPLPAGMGEETYSRAELEAAVRDVFGRYGYVSQRRWRELRPDGPSWATLRVRLGGWREVARIGLSPGE